MRLIGYAQAGHQVSADLALKRENIQFEEFKGFTDLKILAGGPLPRFDGNSASSNPPPSTSPAPLLPQTSGGPIRVPPLTPENITQYTTLFDQSGAQNGVLSGQARHPIKVHDELICFIGDSAKQIFERTKLPNDVLGRIWNLADTHQRGELGLTEFMIAMHLLASYRNGSLRALPQLLPAGLYEAASRRGGPRPITGSRPSSGVASISPVNRQFSGSGFSSASNPGIRPTTQQPQSPPGDEWVIGAREKETFDQVFSTLDTENRSFITGEQAVGFFSNSRLPEEVLAQIWDLADIHSEGRLNRDEFAVAMFLIRQERTKRDPRDTLPQKLPPNLVPPSMRSAPLAIPHPTVPASEPPPVITAQKSAADDLLGLDTSIPSAPQVSSSTRDQQLHSPLPFLGQGSTQAYQAPQHSSSFEAYVPPVSFDQAMRAPTSNVSPQTVGFPNLERPVRSESLQQKSAMDDLLGDNDPEISKKLTQETADLANLSNQVSNLTSQMQQVKAKRISTEQDLSKAQTQKRDFEVRLTQLRSAYEQESSVVTALGERLLVSKNELRTLQEDMAQVHLTHQNLQAQHKELTAVLEADRNENAAIKERIRQSNIEIDSLKPQLEKLKSDARQQKGLVAINKKQLATNELERARIKREIDTASIDLEEAKWEAEESARKLREEPEVERPRTLSLDPTANRPSPATNMNPFLRRPATEISEQGDSSAFTGSNVVSPNHIAFDNFFGPPPTTQPQAGPPATSFLVRSPVGSDDQSSTPTVSAKAPEGQITISPSDSSFLSSEIETPHIPPAPPRSRQITSSFLPLRNLQRSDSTSSSVVVAPPGSRAGGASGSQTPTDLRPPNVGSPRQLDLKQKLESQVLQPQRDEPHSSSNITDEISSPDGQIEVASKRGVDIDDGQLFGQPSTVLEVPGAFPGDTVAKPSSQLSRSNSSKSTEDYPTPSAAQLLNNSAQTPDQENSASSSRNDFSAAFEGFDGKGKGIAKTNGNTFDDFGRTGPSNRHGEFPPIEELRSNEDSDSESDYGFDDDFTKTSPQRPPKVLDTPTKSPDRSTEERTLSSDPSSNATRSPDPIQPSIPAAQPASPISKQPTTLPVTSGNQDSKQFPTEHLASLSSPDYKFPPASSAENLVDESTSLPKRQGEGLGLFADRITRDVEPASNPPPSDSRTGPLSFSAPYSPDQGSSKQLQLQPVVPPKTAHHDDFEKEFGDLAEAKEADDKGEDDVILAGKDTFDDFNPVFDSPVPSKTTINPNHSTSIDNGFNDFELSNTGFSVPGGLQKLADQPNSKSNHDWDALFAGLDKFESKNAEPGFQSTGHSFDKPTQPQQPPSSSEVNKPALHRGLSTGTDHDDPILKRLTGMGYPRDASLSALEKFDYNIDKVRSILSTSLYKSDAYRFHGLRPPII